MNKLQKFQSFIYSKNFDLFCVTESWLHESIHDNEILPSDYTIYRNDRGERGGGVLVAIKNTVTSKLILKHNTVELLTIQVNLSPCLLLVCLYIPPNSSEIYQQEILRYIATLPSGVNTILLLGDFNVPDIDWNTLSARSPFSRDLCDTLLKYSYLQLIQSPTHTQGNVLDLLLTNAPHRLCTISIEASNVLKSDHFVVSAAIQCLRNNNPTHKLVSSTLSFLNYRKADLPKLCGSLCNAIESYAIDLNDIDKSWSELKTIIASSCLCSVPRVSIPTRSSPKWFNASIRHQLNKASSLRRCRNIRHPICTASSTSSKPIFKATSNQLKRNFYQILLHLSRIIRKNSTNILATCLRQTHPQ